MLINAPIEVKWHNASKKHYESLGYKFTKQKDVFYVGYNDIPETFTTLIPLRCDNCGDKYELQKRMYTSRLNSDLRDLCKKCKRRSGDSPTTYFENIVKPTINKQGYTLLPGQEYIGQESILSLTCNKHPESGLVTTYWRMFQSGHFPCQLCRKENKSTDNEFGSLTSEMILESGSVNGLVVLNINPDKLYKFQDEVNFTCALHPQEIQSLKISKIRDRKFPCTFCLKEYMSSLYIGEKSPSWKGGMNDINTFIRDAHFMKEWKMNTLKHFGFRCALSNTRKNLEIHHLYSLSKKINDVLKENKLENIKVGDFSLSEYKIILREMKQFHKDLAGVPLSKPIHNLYHELYGDDNTPEQFEGFQNRYNRGEFEGLFYL